MLPAVGGTFCDAKRRDELDSFFRDRVKDYNGGPRALAQTLEGIDLCISARKTLGARVDGLSEPVSPLTSIQASASGRIGDPVPASNLERSGHEHEFERSGCATNPPDSAPR